MPDLLSAKFTETEKIRFQAILDSAVDGVITIDAQGTMETVNPAAEALFGYSRTDMVGRNVCMLMPPPFREEHDGYLQNYQKTRTPKIIGIGREVIGQRKDGTTFPLYLAVSETQYDGKTVYTGFLHDLTSLRDAEKQRSELGRILESSLNEMMILNTDSLEIVMVNQGLINNSDHQRKELVGRHVSRLLTNQSATDFSTIAAPLHEGTVPIVEFESTVQRSNKTSYPVLVQLQNFSWKGQPAIVAFLFDRSVRKRQELDLRIRNQAIESANEGIVIADAQAIGHPIVFANPAFLNLTGFQHHEVIGQGCDFLCGDQRDSPDFRQLQDAIQHEREFQTTIECSRKDNTIFWNEISVAPVRNEQGLVTHIVAVMEDVSDRREAQQQLLQSERLAAIGQMVTGLAHESRNALQRAQACLDMLALDLQDQPDQLELTAKTHRALNDLHRYYEEVRNYAAPIKLVRRQTDIADLWKITWRNLDPILADKSIEFTESRADDLPLCMVDDHRIEQVFRNILENSISAMPTDGQLHIDGSVMTVNTTLHIRVSFRDNGPGLQKESLEKATHPFFTTKQKGTGLGLAISKRIIDAHGGSLHIGNATDGGAEIIVTLPVNGVATKNA
ncbi:MAG: PAS domain S-box protein [Fuerstiella sp.]